MLIRSLHTCIMNVPYLVIVFQYSITLSMMSYFHNIIFQIYKHAMHVPASSQHSRINGSCHRTSFTLASNHFRGATFLRIWKFRLVLKRLVASTSDDSSYFIRILVQVVVFSVSDIWYTITQYCTYNRLVWQLLYAAFLCNIWTLL